MRLFGMFYTEDIAQRQALMCQSLGFRSLVETKGYNGKTAHWVYIEPKERDAEKRLMKKRK